MSGKPLVFISCGQLTADELALGKAIEELVRSETAYDAYFAEQQNTLQGLVDNILSSLGRCSAFIGVMHHRGSVTSPAGAHLRGSVWVEQEVAIAAFIQHVIQRPITVALYMREDIALEGIRQQLRLKPVIFRTNDNVLADLRTRIASWTLSSPAASSLQVEWKREDVRITSDRHDYRLNVDIANNGRLPIDRWRVELWFPWQYLSDADLRDSRKPLYRVERDTDLPEADRRLWPGDRRRVFAVDYYVDHRNWPGDVLWPGGVEPPSVRIRASADGTEAVELEIPMLKLQIF